MIRGFALCKMSGRIQQLRVGLESAGESERSVVETKNFTIARLLSEGSFQIINYRVQQLR
jgi:hypothetical protein